MEQNNTFGTYGDMDKIMSKIKKLKAKKKYFVRIRTFKGSGSKKTYSKWSSVKSVKTKK